MVRAFFIYGDVSLATICGGCGIVARSLPRHKCPRDSFEWDALCSVATVAAAYLDGNLQKKHLKLVLKTLERVRNGSRS